MDTGTLAGQARLLIEHIETPDRLVGAALDKAKASTGVFISLMEEAALAEAAAATRRRSAGVALSDFDGIPFAVKDLFDVAGSVTSAGSRTRLAVPTAPRDSAIVANLRKLGMIPIGKTNLSEFAFSGLGLNPHFGTPTASGREDRVPGGSSSGSAIAVQRGIVPVALGTDTAGSVRVPAAFNGIAGFRPSRGRYDMRGVYPLAASFDTAGLLAKNAEDCVVMDALMRGVAPANTAAPRRFIIERSMLDDPELEPAVGQNLLAFAGLLRSGGGLVEPRVMPSIGRARAAIGKFGWPGGVEAATLHRGLLASNERALIDPRVVARLDIAAATPVENMIALRRIRTGLIRALRHELDGAILILPTVPHVAPLLAPLASNDELFARLNLRTLSMTMIGSFLDMPGLAVASGTDPQGLPTSVLLTGATGFDDAVLAAGRLVLRVHGADSFS
ncbi:glutamyl-tRNA amidotransferase [Mesorhizobium loti]|nr:glutamyl-tRNA amidotransferase [Mesorhizobium loti]